MKRSAFFLQVTISGVESTLQAMADQSPEATLQLRRLERLSSDLKKGLVTLANAAIERNRIAMSILSLLENDNVLERSEQEEHLKLSEILREYLNVSKSAESVSIAHEKDEFDRITLNRKLQLQEMVLPDLSPVPKTAVASVDGIMKLIAANQLELALKHVLTLTQGSAAFENTESIAEQYKALIRQRYMQVISNEEAISKENQISEALIQVLEDFAQYTGKNDKGLWGSIKNWLK